MSRLLETGSRSADQPLKFSDNDLCGQGLKAYEPINMPSEAREAGKSRRYVSEGTFEEPRYVRSMADTSRICSLKIIVPFSEKFQSFL